MSLPALFIISCIKSQKSLLRKKSWVSWLRGDLRWKHFSFELGIRERARQKRYHRKKVDLTLGKPKQRKRKKQSLAIPLGMFSPVRTILNKTIYLIIHGWTEELSAVATPVGGNLTANSIASSWISSWWFSGRANNGISIHTCHRQLERSFSWNGCYHWEDKILWYRNSYYNWSFYYILAWADQRIGKFDFPWSNSPIGGKRGFSIIRKSFFSDLTLSPLVLFGWTGMKQIGLSRRHEAMGWYGRRFSDPSRVNLIGEVH